MNRTLLLIGIVLIGSLAVFSLVVYPVLNRPSGGFPVVYVNYSHSSSPPNIGESKFDQSVLSSHKMTFYTLNGTMIAEGYMYSTNLTLTGNDNLTVVFARNGTIIKR